MGIVAAKIDAAWIAMAGVMMARVMVIVAAGIAVTGFMVIVMAGVVVVVTGIR